MTRFGRGPGHGRVIKECIEKGGFSNIGATQESNLNGGRVRVSKFWHVIAIVSNILVG